MGVEFGQNVFQGQEILLWGHVGHRPSVHLTWVWSSAPCGTRALPGDVLEASSSTKSLYWTSGQLAKIRWGREHGASWALLAPTSLQPPQKDFHLSGEFFMLGFMSAVCSNGLLVEPICNPGINRTACSCVVFLIQYWVWSTESKLLSLAYFKVKNLFLCFLLSNLVLYNCLPYSSILFFLLSASGLVMCGWHSLAAVKLAAEIAH